ncbi:ATPase component of various ABC-type transport systems with duplicated ATPase domain [Sanguibacter keddieii DSM 10542]|uniref:ATPase component of various ABC-type transport systems with duplicated ATPase domain n=1 Tax=Sanguibacter keddieii (strain ATCC 51767 / DSM 10542 / NCFB 3025 / ST-74) TaxID=446469 RepID=D1BBX3_SANKS|nr:ATP-binding cassette domain-containing protein [Sanguibacter keddieii]ACZ20753.1 ATPase component of various ABC-type transport systems with duplicated ATPase domain [Sanguibacter keddieii DSM 10542]
MISLTDVTVTYPRRDTPSLRGVDLHVAAGERVVVLGPSGAGKSTLLHLVAGLVPHSTPATVTGTLGLGATLDLDVDTPVHERSTVLGVVGQDPSASVCLPQVDAELALVLENRAVPPALIGPLVQAALDQVGAGALAAAQTARLSGGQTQRVALAAAVVGQPGLLLLDEPTSMLDAGGVRAVRAAVDEVARDASLTVLLVEHRLDDYAGDGGVEALPGRAVVLGDDGSVVADGPTPSVLREHAAALHRLGCWLPLEAELTALSGAHGDLASRAHDAFLEGLVPRGTGGEGDGGHGAAPLLRARGLAVGHGARTVLDGVDLDVHAGQVVAVLGENGTGKSTLLHALAGLARPHAGTVTGARPGMVFQNPEHQLVAHSVTGEIAHGLTDPDETVARMLREHRLEHVADRSPHQLSGGEKRRLSLAAMLAHGRSVLLADEPTFGLDRRDTVVVADALRTVADAGGAVVLSTHDLRLAAEVADVVVLVGGGRILGQGPARDVLGDTQALADAGLVLPAVVRWFLARCPTTGSLRGALRALGRSPALDPTDPTQAAPAGRVPA